MNKPEFEKLHAVVRAHILLSVDVQGDTVVMTPRGDETGYRPTVFPAELERIEALLKSGRFQNLIVDLGDAPYFGSRMIGALVQLRSLLPEDGRMVFCEPGREMRTILETMRIDQLIPIVDTRRQAVREISTVRLQDRWEKWRAYWPWAAALVLSVTMVLVITKTDLLAQWIGTSESRDYLRLHTVYERIHASASGSASEEAWAEIRELTNKSIQPIKDYYRVSPERSATAFAVYEASNELLMIGNLDFPPEPKRLRKSHQLLTTARKTIVEQVPVELPAPAPLSLPVDSAPGVSATTPPLDAEEVTARDEPSRVEEGPPGG